MHQHITQSYRASSLPATLDAARKGNGFDLRKRLSPHFANQSRNRIPSHIEKKSSRRAGALLCKPFQQGIANRREKKRKESGLSLLTDQVNSTPENPPKMSNRKCNISTADSILCSADGR